MPARFFSRVLLCMSLAGAAPAQTAANGSCYPGVPGPAIDTVTVVLIDSTTPRAEAAIADFQQAAIQAAARSAQRYVVLKFAGLAPGQHLQRVADFTIEAPVSDPARQAQFRIAEFRKSQACVKKTAATIRAQLPQLVAGALPEQGSFRRSEIVYSLHETLREFGAPGRTVRLLVWSDGLEASELSFYANRQPRRIVAEDELRKVPAALRQPLPNPGEVSVLWFGLLAQHKEPGKPVPDTRYQNPKTMEQLKKFWTELLLGWGVRRVQIGHTVLDWQRELDGPPPAEQRELPVRPTLTAATRPAS